MYAASRNMMVQLKAMANSKCAGARARTTWAPRPNLASTCLGRHCRRTNAFKDEGPKASQDQGRVVAGPNTKQVAQMAGQVLVNKTCKTKRKEGHCKRYLHSVERKVKG